MIFVINTADQFGVKDIAALYNSVALSEFTVDMFIQSAKAGHWLY